MATTRTEFDCWYQGGGSLLNQTVCPLELNGEPLQYSEMRIVEDVQANYTPWFVLILLAALLMAQDQSK